MIDSRFQTQQEIPNEVGRINKNNFLWVGSLLYKAFTAQIDRGLNLSFPIGRKKKLHSLFSSFSPFVFPHFLSISIRFFSSFPSSDLVIVTRVVIIIILLTQ